MDAKKESMVVVVMNDEDAMEYSRNHGEELENTYVVVDDPLYIPKDQDISVYQNRAGLVQEQEEVIITSKEIPVDRSLILERKLVKINVEKLSSGNSAKRKISSSPKRNPVEMKTPSSKENPLKRKFSYTDAKKSKPKFDICRLCLSKNCDFFPLFWTKLRFSALPLSNVIETCLGIRVDKEDVTDRICQVCLINLESVWAFREKCQQSNETITRMNLNIDNVKPISGSEIQIPDKRTKDNVSRTDATMNSLVTSSVGGQKVVKSRENRESNSRHTTIEEETIEEFAEMEQVIANEEWIAEEAVTMADDPEMMNSDQEITEADNDYEIEAETETPSEKIPGNRDGTWIFTDGKGYYYYSELVRNSRRYLCCTETTICAVRAIMGMQENAPIRITNENEHSHPPNFKLAEERKFLHLIKKRAIEDTHMKISEIMEEVAARMKPGVILDRKNLMRTMRRARKSASK